MGQNLAGMAATGTYSDSSTQDITTAATWTSSDTTLATVGSSTGLMTIQAAGQIWGGDVSVTATDGVIVGTAKGHIIASDSGSISPLMPQLDSHWQALGLSPWGSYFGLQEASGSMCMGSGSFQFALTASTTAGQGVVMQATEPGWTRNFVVMTGSLTSIELQWPSNTGPATNQSFAMLCYAHVGMLAGSNFGIMGVLGASTAGFRITSDQLQTSTGQVGATFNNVVDNLCGPITQICSDRVHPYLIAYNTSSFLTLMATDVSICTSGSSQDNFNTVNNVARGIGGVQGGVGGVSASYCYFAVCTGSIAEFYSDPANAGPLLNSLGWNCHWASCPVDSGTINLPFLVHHWKQLGLTPWTATWNLQDARGTMCTDNFWPGKNLNGWNFPASSVDAYLYPPAAGWSSGWSRNGILFTETTAHQLHLTPATWPGGQFDPTGSFAVLTYLACKNQGVAMRNIAGIGSSQPGEACFAYINTSNQLVLYCSGSTATGSAVFGDMRVRPCLLVYDQTNSRVKLYSDQEAITGSFAQLLPSANVTGTLGIGGITTPNSLTRPVSGTWVYASFCTGALAESFSTDGVASAFLKTLGFNPPW